MRNFIGSISLLLLLLSAGQDSFAQKSETDNLLKQADKLFEEERYAEAYPLYTQLLSLKKGDADITFKYGATLLYGSDKKADAIGYLQKASLKTGIDPRTFYFLGRAYQLNYEFDKSITAYKKFAQLSDAKSQEKYQLDLALRQCENGKELLSNIKEVIVLDRTDVEASDFFRYYQLENLSGKILLAPEEFQSAIDKKNGHRPIIYSTPLSNIVYFSSYGKKGDQGKDIYYSTRKGDGSWSEPIVLPSTINTPYNEDFPFMHPDGKTLYFCSEGHNSMGGYDIFKTSLNPFSGEYSRPENLDFAINTPDNDILYIADSLNQNAFFASSRASKQDRISVYEVKVDLLPSSIILLKGDFLSEIDPSLKNARITIEDSQTKRQLGIYNTEADGSYLLDFNYGGAYTFYVEAGNSGIIHTGKVEIPRLETIAAFKQELVMIDDNGVERLMIKNYFDEALEGDMQELLSKALKKRAELDITPADLRDEKALAQQAAKQKGEIDDLYLAAGFSKMHSNKEVADWALKKEKELVALNEEYTSLSAKAYSESVAYQNEADRLIAESKEAFNGFESSNDDMEKQALLRKSITLRNEAKSNLLNAASAMMISTRLNKLIDERSEQVLVIQNAQSSLNQGMSANDKVLIAASLNDLSAAESAINENKLDDDVIDYLADVKELEHMKASQAYDSSEQLRNDKNEYLSLIKRLETQAQNEKGSKKEATERELMLAQNELADIESEIPKKWEKYREDDWNSKVAEAGYNFATEWDYSNVSAEIAAPSQLDASGKKIDQGKESIAAMESKDNEALLSLGMSYEELLGTVPEELAETDRSDETKQAEDNALSSFENQLLPDYDKKAALIASNPNKLEQMEESLLLNSELLKEIDRNLENNTSGLSEEELIGLKAQKENDQDKTINEFREEIESIQEINFELNDFIPEFEEELNEIKSEDISQLERNNKLSDFYKASVDRLELLLFSVNEMPYPEDDPYIMRQHLEKVKALKVLITELKANQYQIEENNARLGQIAALPSEKEMITSLDDNYESKWQAIENSQADADMKEAQKIQLNESLISKLNMEMAALNGALESANQDEKILIESKIDLLEEIKSAKEDEINAAVLLMAQGEVSAEALVSSNEMKEAEKSAPSKDEMIESVSPRFIKEINAIELSDMPQKDKLIKKESLYKDLSTAITYKLMEMESSGSPATEKERWVSLQREINEGMDAMLIEMNDIEDETAFTETSEESKNESEVVEERSQTWDNAMKYELTASAIDLFDQKGKIAKDPGFPNSRLSAEGAKYQNDILEINALIDMYEEFEVAANASDDKEAKKIRKEQEQLMLQLEQKQNVFFTKWIPLLHIANEEMPSGSNYLALSKTAFTSAEDKKGEEKLNVLKESYFLALLGLQSAQDEGLAGNKTTRLPLSQFANSDLNYNSLSIKEKKLILQENISGLEANILATEELRSKAMENMDQSEMAKWNAIEKTYQEALVWNQNKLAELSQYQEEVQLLSDQKMATLKAPTGNDALVKAFSSMGLNEAQSDLVMNDAELQTYYAMKIIDNELQKNISSNKKMQAAYREQAGVSMERYQSVNPDKAASPAEAKSMYGQKAKYYAEAMTWYQKSDSLDVVLSSIESKKERLRNDIDSYYATLENENKAIITDINEGRTPEIIVEELVINDGEDEEIMEEVIVDELIEEEVITDRSIDLVDEEAPVQEENQTKGFLFEEGRVFYSGQDPIPVNPPLPEGLIYKVQIGAFRNPLPPEHFVGLSPMMVEKLDNGINRYSVGIFRNLEDAKAAKVQVNGIGYEDAFIVAFYNGKRVSLNEALRVSGGTQTITEDQANTGNVTTPVQTQDFGQRVNDSSPAETAPANAAKAVDVNSIKEVFYTVQVGVFSKRVEESELFGIQPLNVEVTSNGFYRYTSGVYADVANASRHKEYVLNKGVSDAFITAYYNGKRISLDKAKALLEENPELNEGNSGEELIIEEAENNVVLPLPVIEESVPEEREEVEVAPHEEVVVSREEKLPEASDLSYVIFIGSYTNSIPNNVATALLENSDVGIKRAINGGSTIYSTKELSSLNEATILLQRFHERGVDQAKILYVLDGNEISEEEAYKILRK